VAGNKLQLHKQGHHQHHHGHHHHHHHQARSHLKRGHQDLASDVGQVRCAGDQYPACTAC
jgi:hypothetical protein